MADPRPTWRLVRVVPTMGTVFTLDVRPPYPPDTVVDRVIRWWHHVDETFSPFRPASMVSHINDGTLDAARYPAEISEVLALCEQAKAATGGYFDARAAGALDPCGLVKGWSVEKASAILTAAGSPNHCINGGGDIRCSGRPQPGRDWHVGIAHPMRPRELAATVALDSGAIATSGIAERGHHVLNPSTGSPAAGLASVTVTGPDLTWADAYATAAFAMGKNALAWLHGLADHEGLIIRADGTGAATPGFQRASG